MFNWLVASFVRGRSLARSRGLQLVGFGLSILIMGAISLLAIPAMIAASGVAAWGTIALGQAIGAIAGVVVGYGWGWFGPARIARSSATDRRSEYLESIVTRAVLALPATTVSAIVAYLLAPSTPLFAVAGAVYSTSIGLSAGWYFVGLARPFTMLILETVPRAVGAGIGIVLMYAGHSAMLGPVGMWGGMIAGFSLSTVWILWETHRSGAEPRQRRTLAAILVSNRHGVTSALGSNIYYAAPLTIVSVVAPGILPAFALADKIKTQVYLASSPAVTVLQGWVPRGTELTRVRRANTALVSGCLFAVALGIGTAVAAPSLIGWLGNDQIPLSEATILLMSACVSATFLDSVLARVVLATFEQLRAVTRAVAGGSIVGLPLVGVGAHQLGTAGAVAGVLAGLLVCVAIELITYVRVVARQSRVEGAGAPEYA